MRWCLGVLLVIGLLVWLHSANQSQADDLIPRAYLPVVVREPTPMPPVGTATPTPTMGAAPTPTATPLASATPTPAIASIVAVIDVYYKPHVRYTVGQQYVVVCVGSEDRKYLLEGAQVVLHWEWPVEQGGGIFYKESTYNLPPTGPDCITDRVLDLRNVVPMEDYKHFVWAEAAWGGLYTQSASVGFYVIP